ncbi:MAG: response regulator transcription factor [Burkholderiaceae bacterium]|nr:response regulator transcription factor [Burkholderiaceae bacterium]
MPSALIAEDEPLLAAALKSDLARLWPELQIVGTAADGLSAAAQALALRPEVCLLDIRMPGASGLEAAQAIAEDWPQGEPFPLLVFVTAYDQYALAAFEAQAVDYLVKPVDMPRLAACVARLKLRLTERRAPVARNDLQTPPDDGPLQQTLSQLRALLGAAAPAAASSPRLTVIQAGTGTTVHFVPIAEVLYFEAADKYLRVVTADREHLIRLSLRELLPQLDAQEFWQVHRSLVVRASAIATAQRDDSGKVYLKLRDRPERLTASRLYAHLFKGM